MNEAYEQDVKRADEALWREDFETAFRHLERAHVLAQCMTGRHTFIHWRMLVAGQVSRIVASLLFCRLWLPRGSSGRARVGAFAPMPVPAGLQHLAP